MTNPPERIVSLLASATEILYGLGLGDRVVGVSHECDYPPGVADKPRVTCTTVDAAAASKAIDEQVRACVTAGEPLYRIDVDTLAALAPELIVTQSQCDVCAVSYTDVQQAVSSVDALAQTEVVDLNPTSLDGVFDDILRVARAADCLERGQAFVDALRARVRAVADRTAGLNETERPRVACIEWTDPVMLGGNWMPELVRLAGGRDELTAAGKPSEYCDWAAIVAYNPEVIVVMPCGFDLARAADEGDALAARPGWSALSAVRDGRVHAVDANAYFNRPGPRLVDSLELLAHLIHPQRCAAPARCADAWRTLA